MNDEIFDHFRTNPVGYGSTYFAHPVCCAAAFANLTYILDIGLVDYVHGLGSVMEQHLNKMVETHPSVKQARNIGLGLCLSTPRILGLSGGLSEGYHKNEYKYS